MSSFAIKCWLMFACLFGYDTWYSKYPHYLNEHKWCHFATPLRGWEGGAAALHPPPWLFVLSLNCQHHCECNIEGKAFEYFSLT